MNIDDIYMGKCLDLALKGLNKTLSNPMVGCVIVYNKKIIGKGYHKKFGDNHAEVNAINSVKNKKLLKQSTLYVNLEPCSHFGKTPPCVDLIIKHQIPKVVIGSLDPFFKVSGNGIKKLENNGINVVVNILSDKNRELNKKFFTFHEKKRPYIILKWANSKDGFIAKINQKEPLWLTSRSSKKLVHKWRSEEIGILIGTETALKDNPSLTVREVNARNPIRLIIDQNLRLPKNLSVFNNDAKTFILTKKPIFSNHIETDFNNLAESICKNLYNANIQSVLIEGGSKTLQTFIDANLWDEARVFTTKNKLNSGIKGPIFNFKPYSSQTIDVDTLEIFYR